MANKMSVAVRNAILDAIETAVGTAAVLRMRTGSPPAAITDADSGTVLVSITLPTDWMAAASSGTKALLGTWQGTATGAGTVGHYRIYASDGTTQHMQGTMSATGGGGDMTITNAVIAVDDVITVDTFTLTGPNA